MSVIQCGIACGLAQMAGGFVLAKVPPNTKDDDMICLGISIGGLIQLVGSCIALLVMGTSA